jgi:hypothetical protein
MDRFRACVVLTLNNRLMAMAIITLIRHPIPTTSMITSMIEDYTFILY